jgi:ABC-2 type transport system permease protein
MLQAVADEKENRTMEILVTSILPEQLLLGKLLGLLAVAMTQIFVWISLLSIGIAILSNFISALQGISLPLDYLSTAFLFFLPSFVMISGLMTAIGSIVTDYSQGQQIAGLLNLPFMLPWFLSPILFSDPNHPLMVFLTMVPMSSFLTIAMRWSLTSIPFWQISISWLLLAASSAFSLWSATKIFRLGMLSYGKRLSLRAIFAGLQRTAVPALKDREAGQEV